MANDSGNMISALRRHAFRIETGDWCVPEPFVKELLAGIGVNAPAGAVVAPDMRPSTAAAALKAPVVLKAWGPGIVHKSELGAVRVGVPRDAIDAEGAAMLAAVAGHGIDGARLYVEEMADGGTEILFGMISRPPFGTLAILGMGGTWTELFGDPAVRLCPLSVHDVAEMVDEFRGAALLKGYRGAPIADRIALIAAIMALAGPAGLAEQLGSSFAEFECNPLFVSASGVVAADARLILHAPDEAQATNGARDPFDGTALFAPRSVAVVGASTSRKTAWGNRTIARYRQLGWTDNLYAVHPTASEIDGVPAYPSLADIPGGVDYAEISVGAALAPGVLRAAKGKVKTATVNAAGFSEMGDEGHSLEADLIAAAIDGGVRFIGPNCMGIYSPRGRQAFSGANAIEPGHVGAVLQSGGLATDLIQTASTQGVRFSSVASAGNTADVRLSDLVGHLADDPETKTIGIHIEGGADVRLVEVLRRLAGRKPVVLLVPGLSATGSRVAASHTGSMTSERRGWDALAIATGVTVTETFEEFLAALVYLDRYRDHETDHDDSVLIMGLGGGASVLAADACDARGLRVPILSAELQRRLGDKKGGISINPLDVRLGPAGPPAAAREILEMVLPAQHFADVIIHVNMMNYCNSVVPGRLPGIDHFVRLVENLTGDVTFPARIAIVARNLGHTPGEYRDMVRQFMATSKLPVFERFSDAATAIAAAQHFGRHRRLSGH